MMGELDGVGQEVEQYLLDAQRIAKQGWRQGRIDLAMDRQMPGLGPNGDHLASAGADTVE